MCKTIAKCSKKFKYSRKVVKVLKNSNNSEKKMQFQLTITENSFKKTTNVAED